MISIFGNNVETVRLASIVFGFFFDLVISMRSVAMREFCSISWSNSVRSFIVISSNFAFNSLKDSQYKVIIRTHPERPYDKISKDLFFEISEQKNFSVSQSKHVKDDLMVSDIVVYWGSTVSLEALKMGIPVIHIDLDDVISVDPLLDCKYLKWTVKNTCELLDVITEIYGLSDGEYKEQHSKAEAYIEEYLQKVTDKRLQEFVL